MPQLRVPTAPNLTRLLEDAHEDAMAMYLSLEDFGSLLPDSNEMAALTTNTERAAALRALARDRIAQIEAEAVRVVRLSDGAGAARLTELVHKRGVPEQREQFDRQLDGMCRAIWAFRHCNQIFNAAEQAHLAMQFRDCGALYDAFELADGATVPCSPDGVDREKLSQALTKALDLEVSCEVDVFQTVAAAREPEALMVLVRHPGPLSSVAEYRRNGERGRKYYVPPSEATLVYTPSLGKIEVCSGARGVRGPIADAFAAATLGQDISAKPLTWRAYDLSRFLKSCALAFADVDGWSVRKAGVVSMIAQTAQSGRRVALFSHIDDDMDAAIGASWAGGRRAMRAIVSLEIAISAQREGKARPETLKIRITARNKCNLRSELDPERRALGQALLNEWGVSRALRQIDASEMSERLPFLLDMYDSGDSEFKGSWFHDRKLDAGSLVTAAFISSKRIDDDAIIDDDDGVSQAVARLTEHPQRIRPEGADGVLGEERAIEEITIYELHEPWLVESILSTLKPHFDTAYFERVDRDLIAIGDLAGVERETPCFLARRLHCPDVIARLSRLLRGRGQPNVGLVIACGETELKTLGPNVVANLPALLASTSASELTREPGRALRRIHATYRTLGRGGDVVDFVSASQHVGTLYLPGQQPLDVVGAKRVRAIRLLTDAHRTGVGRVATSDLLEGAESTAISQLFGKKLWDEIEGVYVEQAGRGFWRLANLHSTTP